jgi:hypothetical protein
MRKVVALGSAIVLTYVYMQQSRTDQHEPSPVQKTAAVSPSSLATVAQSLPPAPPPPPPQGQPRPGTSWPKQSIDRAREVATQARRNTTDAQQ